MTYMFVYGWTCEWCLKRCLLNLNEFFKYLFGFCFVGWAAILDVKTIRMRQTDVSKNKSCLKKFNT